MKQVNMKSAVTWYNDIMECIAREHNTIGTSFSENTSDWNLRDMVSEMQYTLDMWNDPDSLAWQDAHDESQPIWNGRPEWLYNWQKEKARMSRFIKAYAPFVSDMECAVGHCSIYD